MASPRTPLFPAKAGIQGSAWGPSCGPGSPLSRGRAVRGGGHDSTTAGRYNAV